MLDKTGRAFFVGAVVNDFDGDGPHAVLKDGDGWYLQRAFDHKCRSPSGLEDWHHLEIIGMASDSKFNDYFDTGKEGNELDVSKDA